MKIYNLLDKMEFLNEVATLEYNEWALKPEVNKETRLRKKIQKIRRQLKMDDFCKLVLLDEDKLVGFISIFPSDSDECSNLTPWYSTMYVKSEYRGRGYSRLLNNAILAEAKKRDYKEIYLKTDLNDYYEKFGAKFIRMLNNGEKLYKIVIS